MAYTMNDNFVLGRTVEDQIRVGRSDHTPHARSARHLADLGMPQDQVDNGANAFVNPARALRGMPGDVIKHSVEIGKRIPRVSKPHRPCLDQTARTSSSVANSPRAAAASDRANAASSSGVNWTIACSSPVN